MIDAATRLINFQSPFRRGKDCNRPRAALMDPSRMSKISVFFEAFYVSSHQTSPHSSKKCISPVCPVFMPIREVVRTDFANRFLGLPGVRSLVVIRENRSQIHLPSPVSKAQCGASTRLVPTKEVSLLLHRTATENALQTDLIQNKVRRSTSSSFSQIAPPFPQKPDLRFPHNTSAQNRRNSHSTHFPRCGVGGGIHSSDNIRRICPIASRVLRRSVSEIGTAVIRPVGIR